MRVADVFVLMTLEHVIGRTVPTGTAVNVVTSPFAVVTATSPAPPM
jgi:hypothetical protein